MFFILYDTESQSRNVDFILIALRAIPQPSGQRPVKLKNPPANGRSILRTFPSEPFEPRATEWPIQPPPSVSLRSPPTPREGGGQVAWRRGTLPYHLPLMGGEGRQRRHYKICGVSRHRNPRPERPSNLRTLRTLGAQPRQPSRRRRVPWRPPFSPFMI